MLTEGFSGAFQLWAKQKVNSGVDTRTKAFFGESVKPDHNIADQALSYRRVRTFFTRVRDQLSPAAEYSPE